MQECSNPQGPHASPLATRRTSVPQGAGVTAAARAQFTGPDSVPGSSATEAGRGGGVL